MRPGMWLRIRETGQILTTDLGWRSTLITYDTGNWAGVESYFNSTHYYYCYLLLKFDDTHIKTISIYNAIIIRVAFFFHDYYWYPSWRRLPGQKSFFPWNQVETKGSSHSFFLGLLLIQWIRPWLKNLRTGCIIQIVWLFFSPSQSPTYSPS